MLKCIMVVIGLTKMKEMKPLDYQLLFELMKDSHRSDRQLAKALGISQPTVTRRRAMLEDNIIEDYTDFPQFLRCQQQELCEFIVETQSFQADLKPGVAVKPFNLKYLAKSSK